MGQRYCTNPKSLQEANRACWCPKFWCWVSEDCPSAKHSTFFADVDLWYSYEACGNSVDACFDEDAYSGGGMEDEFLDALDEDHSKDDETELQDVVHALVVLTINVNTLTKVVNSLSKQVSALNSIATETDPDAAIIAPEYPDILPTTFYVEGYTESDWGELGCPMGYKTIGTEKGCDAAGEAMGYNKKDNDNTGKGDKLCVYSMKLAGHLMSKKIGGDDLKMICQKVRKD